MQTRLPPPFPKRARRYVRYLLMRTLFFLIGTLPLRAAIRLGEALGGLIYRLAPKERRKALASLAVAFPEKSEAERLALARESFCHMGACGAELCCFKKIEPLLERYVEMSSTDLALLKEAFAAGRGMVFVTAHVGNFELMARRIGVIGHPCSTVAKPPSDPHSTAFLEKLREQSRVRTIWRGRGTAVAEIRKALAGNEAVGFLIDQDTKVRGVFVEFFGRMAHTARSPAEFALETGAAVVMGFIFRRPGGGHLIRLERLPAPEPSADRDGEVRALTQAMTEAIERAVRRAPETWVWIHQRWKTRPPEEVSQPKEPDLGATG